MSVRQPNPYRPGFNQPPMVLAGRESLIHDADDALEVAAYDYRTPRPLILVGPRGVGKTVTLGEIAQLAAERHAWPTVHVEAVTGRSMVEELIRRLRQVTQLLEGEAPTKPRRRPRIAGGKVSAHAFGFGGEVTLETADGAQTAAQLSEVLGHTMAVAVERDAGLLLTIDELHAASAQELAVLSATLQENTPRDWPLVVAAAALPSIRITRGKRKLPTYLERAEWHELGPLEPADARRALTEPAAQAGRPMTHDAADELLELAGGYPYAVQVAGHYAWRESHGGESITLAHAQQARPRVQADLEQLFIGRWDDASGRERDYLTAIAELAENGQQPHSAEVASGLGATTPAVSYLRERLIKKGTIYPTPDGRLHFITPGMGAWIRRR